MKTEDTEALGRELSQARSKPDTVDQPVRIAHIYVIFPLFAPHGGRWPPKVEKTRPDPGYACMHAKYGVNRPTGCWEIVDRTKKTNKQNTVE